MMRALLVACTVLGALPRLAVIVPAPWPDPGLTREVRRAANR